MNRIKRRAMFLYVLIGFIALGLCFYIIRFSLHGEEWTSFSGNGNAYSGGKLMMGTVTDRNGVVLASVRDGKRIYSEDEKVRRSTLHLLGDREGNIGTGVLKNFVSELTGYDPITGIYSFSGDGKALELSIDKKLNEAAREALDGRNGAVGVINYKTGETLCMVSGPDFDPDAPPELSKDDRSGVYINRFISSAFTPGSVFKLVTLAAAIENIPDLFDRTFSCEGETVINGETVTCTRKHGELKIEDALAVSCNCVFAELALELGSDILFEYAAKYGLTESFLIDNISTVAGNFKKAEEGTSALAWSGIGQYEDTVNPAAMLRFVAAIANEGKAPKLTLIKGEGGMNKERLIKKSTAKKLAEMMNYNVYANYGTENFPNLSLYAKSGTAEVGGDKEPHAWFVGFIDNADHPYAFVVMVENGGWGSLVAGDIANRVLQTAVNG